MPKFLARVTLNAEGVRLLRQDKGSGRRAAVTKAVEAAGGKVEAFYFAYGQDDTIIIADYGSFEKASIRLWLFPPRETPEDRAIREEGERLRRAFPAIDFDHPGARVWRPSDDA